MAAVSGFPAAARDALGDSQLRANLAEFTLASVLEEVQRWLAEGVSRFAQQWQTWLESTATPVPNTG